MQSLGILNFAEFLRTPIPQNTSGWLLLAFVQDRLFRNSATITGKNICVEFSFLIRLQASSLTLYQKKSPVQVFSWDFCEYFSNNFSKELFRVTPSKCHNQVFSLRYGTLKSKHYFDVVSTTLIFFFATVF